MKTLFLDFDGPLFSDRGIRFHPHNRKPYPGKEEIYPLANYWKMDDPAVFMLNYLYDLEPFDTVVSSTWRKHFHKEGITELFKVNELNLHFAEDWATAVHTHTYSCARADEIEAWLRNHDEVTDYFILDDKESGWSLLPPDSGMYVSSSGAHGLNQDRIFLVNSEHGLDSFTFKKMLELFPKPEEDIFGLNWL